VAELHDAMVDEGRLLTNVSDNRVKNKQMAQEQ
jgi:hypothetical protein